MKGVNHHAVWPIVVDLELTRRGVKVGLRFRLQGRFTSPSRQPPQVERESDQSTRKGLHQHGSSLNSLVLICGELGPYPSNNSQHVIGLPLTVVCITGVQQHGDVTKFSARGFR